MKKSITVKTRSAGEKPRKEKLTIGLDLGDRSSRYCVLDEQDDVIGRKRCNDQEGFGSCV